MGGNCCLLTIAPHFRDVPWNGSRLLVESDHFHPDHGKQRFQSVLISPASCHISIEEGLSTETAQPEADEKPKEVEVVIIPWYSMWVDCQFRYSRLTTQRMHGHVVKHCDKKRVSQPALRTFLLDLYPRQLSGSPQHRTWEIKIPFDASMSVSFYQNGLVLPDFSMWVVPSRSWGQRCKSPKNTTSILENGDFTVSF